MLTIDLQTCTSSELNDCLRKFYCGLRTKKGEKYQKSSYLGARSALQRHLTDLKRPYNLRQDAAFNESNRVLDAVLKANKASGQCKLVQHKEAMSEADKTRLQDYFADVLDSQDTYKLQSYCWFNIARHFGLRGGEIFSRLKRTDLEFNVDEDGPEYIRLKADFVTKNTKGGIQSREFKTCGIIS